MVDDINGLESTNRRTLAAIKEVPRKVFVAAKNAQLIAGHSIPPEKATLKMLSAITFRHGDHVLQVGTGSGYLAAIMASLASHVISIEKVPMLASLALRNIRSLRLYNVEVITGDGAEGYREGAPYNTILVSTPSICNYNKLFAQLKDGGKLFSIEGENFHHQILVEYTKNENRSITRRECGLIDFSRNTGEILLEMGMLDEANLAKAKEAARSKKTPLIEEILKLVQVEDAELYRSLATQHNLKLGNVEKLLKTVDTALFEQFPRAFLDHNKIIPLSLNDEKLVIASSDPEAPLDDLKKLFNKQNIEIILVTPKDFYRIWSTLDLLHHDSHKQAESAESTANESNEDLLERLDTKIHAHLISLFEAILLDSISENASDIHLERYGKKVRVRQRIDGELHDVPYYNISPEELNGLINVIKLRAELDIAEKRLPQGGRARLRAGKDTFDLRVQTQPSLHGEHVIIRILPQTSRLLTIKQLGFSDVTAREYRRLLDNPAGLVLVVGPTGSGKSTTLYAGLQELADDGRRKVITVEDPIEYSIDNVQQTRVRPDIGFTFANAMRAFVREDPDVVLVGEIRDQETALEAIRASQTGHIVLSTLHSNDSVDALQRIYDLGIHPNSIASELLAVIAQHLAKRICPHCKQAATPDPKILAEVFPEGVPDSFQCFEGAGCEQCGGRGTKGRVAVIEFLLVNQEIRNAISLQPPIGQLRTIALDAGLVTMRDSAIDHVIQGTIPLSELPRILPKERMAPEARGQVERKK